jgi:hypothetical protein
MKKLLLLVGFVVSIAANTPKDFEEYQKFLDDKNTEDTFVELFNLEDELYDSIRVGAGAIHCDILNKLSAQKRDALKKKALVVADSNKNAESLAVKLYNNIVYCESNRNYKKARSKFIAHEQKDRITSDARKLFDLEYSLINKAGLDALKEDQEEHINPTGYIKCDEIMQQFSQERLESIKQWALLEANSSYEQLDVRAAIILYNNIVTCQDERSRVLSPDYYIRQIFQRREAERKAYRKDLGLD